MAARKIIFAVLLFLGSALVLPSPARAYKCDFLPERKTPSWVEKRPNIPGYYVGVGEAVMGETAQEQLASSQQDALVNLGKEISVTVKGAFSETISVDEFQNNRQEIESTTETKVLALLRDAEIREKWLDRKNCIVWTLAVVSRESVQAVQKDLEEQLRRRFTSKKLMMFSLSNPENPGDTELRVASAFERTMRDMGVRVASPAIKYLPCAKGEYSKLCDEMPETIFGGFELDFVKEKLSDDGSMRARFFKFRGALYFRDRRVSAFEVSCRGVGGANDAAQSINLAAADSCVSAIKGKLKTDMQGSE